MVVNKARFPLFKHNTLNTVGLEKYLNQLHPHDRNAFLGQVFDEKMQPECSQLCWSSKTDQANLALLLRGVEPELFKVEEAFGDYIKFNLDNSGCWQTFLDNCFDSL